MEKIISPSLLSADFLNLGRDTEMLNSSAAQWLHLDVMDGLFVPNISFGMPVVKAMRRATDKVLDVHLMIENPELYIDEFAALGSDIITFHAEATNHIHRAIYQIKAHGKKAGVALCPSTPLSAVEEILGDADMILLMSVNPGFGGQSFIESTLDKLRRLRSMITERGLSTLVQVDGGVGAHNAAQLYEAGADCLVAGNAVFSAPDPQQAILEILGK